MVSIYDYSFKSWLKKVYSTILLILGTNKNSAMNQITSFMQIAGNIESVIAAYSESIRGKRLIHKTTIDPDGLIYSRFIVESTGNKDEIFTDLKLAVANYNSK